MKKIKLEKINKLISRKKLDEAQLQLSKLGSEFHTNPDYLYLRSKIFCLNKLYYIAIDTLLVALEFQQDDKFYNLLAEIYEILGNKELSQKLLNINSRLESVSSLKDEMSGIYRRKKIQV